MRFALDDIQRYLARFYQGAGLHVTPYAYPVTVPSSLAPQLFTVQSNADFVLTRIDYKIVETVNVDAKRAALVTIDVRESGSKEPLTDTPVHLENYAGNGIMGRDLDYPRFFAGGTDVTVTLANKESQTFTNGIDILFSGWLVRVFSN